jgi:hypothetical protein
VPLYGLQLKVVSPGFKAYLYVFVGLEPLHPLGDPCPFSPQVTSGSGEN